jgi:prephenate dehydrogenase
MGDPAKRNFCKNWPKPPRAKLFCLMILIVGIGSMGACLAESFPAPKEFAEVLHDSPSNNAERIQRTFQRIMQFVKESAAHF